MTEKNTQEQITKEDILNSLKELKASHDDIKKEIEFVSKVIDENPEVFKALVEAKYPDGKPILSKLEISSILSERVSYEEKDRFDISNNATKRNTPLIMAILNNPEEIERFQEMGVPSLDYAMMNPLNSTLKMYAEENLHGLDENKFSMLLLNAYDDIVLMEATGEKPEGRMVEVKAILEEAKRRYPDAGPALPYGKYFKDNDCATLESQLMPYMREAKKSPSTFKVEDKFTHEIYDYSTDIDKYNAWRDGELYHALNEKGLTSEEPFKEFLDEFVPTASLAYSLTKSYIEDIIISKDIHPTNEAEAKQSQQTEKDTSNATSGFEGSPEYQKARAAYEARLERERTANEARRQREEAHRKNLEHAKRWVQNAKTLYKNATGKVSKALNSIKEFAVNQAKIVHDDLKEFGSDIKALGKEMKEQTKDGLGKVLRPVKIVGKAAAYTFLAGAGYLAGKGTKLFHKMKARVKGFVLRRVVDGKNFLKNAVNVYTANAIEAKKAMRKARRTVKESIKNGVLNVMNDLKEFGSDIKALGKEMKEQTKDGLGKVLRPVKIVGKAAAYTFLAGAGYLAGKGSKLFHKMKARVKGFVLRRVVDGKNFLKNAVNVYTANAIEAKKAMRKARRAVKDGIIKFGYGIKNKVEDIGYSLSEKAGNAKESAKGLFNRISAKLSKGKDALTSGFEQYIGKPVRHQAAAAALAMCMTANVIKADISGKLSSIRKAVSKKFETAKESVSEKRDTLSQKAESVRKVGKDTAKSWLSKASKTFVGGKTFASNIVSRIKSGGEKALNTVSNTLQGASQSITQGMEAARVSVRNRSRGSMEVWLRAGKRAAYSK